MTVISWKAHHPDRHAKAAAKQKEPRQAKPEEARSQQNTTRSSKKAPLTGKTRKDALMIKARELATAGMCASWTHLLDVMSRAGDDTSVLRLWATAHDKDEIDLICARRNRLQPTRR